MCGLQRRWGAVELPTDEEAEEGDERMEEHQSERETYTEHYNAYALYIFSVCDCANSV